MDRGGLKAKLCEALKAAGSCVLHSVQPAVSIFFPLILASNEVQMQLELQFWNDFKIFSCLQHVFPPFL